MRTNCCKRTLLGLAAVAGATAALVFGQALDLAVADDVEEGRIVDIGGGDADQAAEEGDELAAEEAPAAPAYWIGIQSAPIDSPVLRTHLQLADDVGVVVAEVMPGSPAEKAGVRKHDILIGVGDEQVNDITVLQKAVAESGQKAIELKLIRLAKEMTVAVTPEETPAEVAAAARQPQDLAGQLGGDLFKQLEARGMPNVRVFGPGMVLRGRQADFGALPNGVSVSVSREGDNPAEITVKKDGKTWTVKGDDKEAIEKLPDDVRPLVERFAAGGGALGGPMMIQGELPNLNLERLQGLLPGQLQQFDFPGAEEHAERIEAQRKEMMKRMEELEKRMKEFQRRIEGENSENSEPAADPSEA